MYRLKRPTKALMMAAQPESSYNPGAGSSAKLRRAGGKRAIPLAAKVARELGVIRTWANIQTIRLAIESEAEYFQVPAAEVAEMLIRAGKQWISLPQYSFPSKWEQREIDRANTIDRFWFEDARWRYKPVFGEFTEQHRVEHTA